MAEGYIKLHRQIADWEWYKNHNVKILFFHCLLRANHKDNKWQGITVKKGSFITSYLKLAQEVNLTEMKVRMALNKLKLTGEITCQSTSQYTVITINNWDDYQQNNTPCNTQITDEQQTDNIQITTNNNENNDKNDKNDKKYINKKNKKVLQEDGYERLSDDYGKY